MIPGSRANDLHMNERRDMRKDRATGRGKLKKEDLSAVDTIVTHAFCPDGIASAMLLRDALPNAEVVFLQHGTKEIEEFAATPGQLWCDLAPPRERAKEFVDVDAIVLDHHRGQQDVVDLFGKRGVFADEKLEPGVSGATLAYREVWFPMIGSQWDRDVQDAVKLFVMRAGIRDTWQRQHSLWEEACAQAKSLTFFGYEWFSSNFFSHPYVSESSMEIGRLLYAKSIARAQKIASNAMVKGQVAFANERFISDAAEALRELRSDVKLFVGFSYVGQAEGPMSLSYSLRSSTDDVDCSEIAKRNGGGGHTRAAGFSISYPDWVAADPIMLFQFLNPGVVS